MRIPSRENTWDFETSEKYIRENIIKDEWIVPDELLLSESIAKEFKDELGLELIWEYAVVSEDFIREFETDEDWVVICAEQELSEDFIREFKDKVDWNNISYCQELSENFIREFKDKVDWTGISIMQNLSEDFIKEFRDYIDTHEFLKHNESINNFSINFLQELYIEVFGDIIIGDDGNTEYTLRMIHNKLNRLD